RTAAASQESIRNTAQPSAARPARHDRTVVSDESLGRWCESSLGSPIVATLFERGNISRVLGVRLANRQEIVIKIRPWQDRLRACVAVQRHLAMAGYPCPAPLGDVDHVDGWAVSAESLIDGGKQ